MEETEQDFKARPYQEELMHIAKTQNTIIYLPTGSGKTFIAVMLIKELSGGLEEGKHTFFMVNTVALVGQQAGYIKRHSRFAVGQYSGDMNVDFWTDEKWQRELEKHQIMVMTCQIFLNLLHHGIVRLEDVNLLIFDECHHAVNDQPMRQVMQQFEHCSPDNQPRVLGLTATLLNSNCKSCRVPEEVSGLETTFQSTVATCENMAEVCFYSTNPQERMIDYIEERNPTAEDIVKRGIDMVSRAIDFVSSITFNADVLIVQPKGDIPINARLLNENYAKTNKKLRNLLNDVIVHIEMLGLYGGSKACLAHIIQLERIRKKADDMQSRIVITAMITTLTAVRKLFEDEMSDCTVQSQIMKYSSYKMITLIKILETYMPKEVTVREDSNSIDGIYEKKENFCTLVFVQRRFTAKIVFTVLKALSKHDSKYEHISPDFIVGFNNNPYNDTREGALEKKWCLECLKKFQTGETNVLVASDVLEEGMDIQKCNLVVKFDLPQNYRSYIQSKGRARHRTSHYVIMVPETDRNFKRKYAEFQKTEQTLQRLLVGRTLERRGPSEEEVAQDLYDQMVPPYTTGFSSVSLASAIPLLNRYCSMLPQDLFTQLTPVWYIIGEGKPRICIQLPIESPLAEECIIGPPMPTKKMAKRAAALETCKRLHQRGELNDNLLPIGSKCKELDDSNLFPLYKNDDDVRDKEHQPPRGSKKRKQTYPKVFPESLSECRPKPGECLFLHVIEMEPVYQKPDAENNRKLVFYNLLNRIEGFGILCTKPLPKICDFPIYMNVGEISVHLSTNATFMYLSPEEVLQLESFNTMIFRKLLRLMKQFTIVDKEDKENSYFIVPTCIGVDGYEIDWDVVRNHTDIPDIATPSEEVRQNLVVTSEEFECKVTAPWYRGMLPDQNYIVTKVCPDLTPLSPFPSKDYPTYKDYYGQKYKLNIINEHQPLLEVKSISNKINCMRPRGTKVTSATSKRKRQELQEDFEENLVAELCVQFKFPSVLWLKSTCLPTILHRINYILLAEELRQRIVNDTGVGKLDPGDEWKPLKPDGTCVDEEASNQSSPHHVSTIGNKLISLHMVEKKPVNPLNASLFGDDKEPIDIDRNMEDVTLVEVLNYDEFIHKPLYVAVNGNMSPSVNLAVNANDSDNEDDMLDPTINLLRTKLSGIGPQQYEILQALTSASANDIINLERLETLGDSFLKFMVSLFLFRCYPDLDEGKLTGVKGKIIGNRNLYYIGNSCKLSGYVKVQDFNPTSDWIPPGICVCRKLQQVLKSVNASPNFLYELQFSPEEQLKGELSQQTFLKVAKKLQNNEEDEIGIHSSMENFLSVQTVSDKTIADCVEALIGAYLKGSGIRGALKLLLWLQVLPMNATPEEMFDIPPPTADLKFLHNNEHGDIAVHLSNDECATLERCLKYRFRDRSFLLQALTHASYSQNRVTNCYQRLEFLGDAVLDFLITCHIYESCGLLNPGQLTDLRSALVNNVTFASIAVRNGFHKYLKYTSTKLMDLIDEFVRYQEDNGHAINEEVLILLEEEETVIAEAVEVPKVLGDVFESIAGAIYLDSGLNLEEVWRVYYRLMRREIKAFSANVPKQPVRMLYESTQPPPKFLPVKVLEDGKVMVTVEIFLNGKKQYFHGFGDSKAQGKRAAAKCALKKIHEN